MAQSDKLEIRCKLKIKKGKPGFTAGHLTVVTHCFGGWYLFKPQNLSSTVAQKTEGIQLKLANGKIINLSDSAGLIQTDYARKEALASADKLWQRSFEKEKTLSWQQGILYFEGTTLTDITPVITRWFNVKVVIDNSRNADKLFVGIINKRQSLAVFLKDLENVAEIGSYFDKKGGAAFQVKNGNSGIYNKILS